MAKLSGNFEFTGSLGDFTAYKMKGCDRIVIRRKAGPSKQKINNDPSYVRTKENKLEFVGVAKAAKHLRYALSWLPDLADYNFQPSLNKVTKAIQKLDPYHLRGERSVLYSQHHEMLKGFNLNKYHSFDSIVRKPVTCTIDRETCTAVVTIPSLQRGINLNLPWPTPQFRFVVTLGVCGDMLHNGSEYDEHRMDYDQCETAETAWQPADKPYKGETLTLQIKDPAILHDDSSLVAGIGIVFDMTHRYFGNERQDARKPTGSAKILELANPIPVSCRTLQPNLELPQTIHVPQPEEVEQDEEVYEALQKRQQARIVEGYEFQHNETESLEQHSNTDAEPLPKTFSATINVNHSDLWRIILTMAGSFPDKTVTCTIQQGKETPVIAGTAHWYKLVKELENYSVELANDTSLSFGLSVQTAAGITKLWVTGNKYIQYQGTNREQFRLWMQRLDIRHVARLEMVDEYPMRTLPLQQFYPNTKDAKTVITALSNALRE